jgi:uncharacterized protein YndB with AHSA1/START domain
MTSDTTITTPSDTQVVMTRILDAPRELVFDAYTNPKHVPHWLLGPEGWTMPVCEIDLRPGGRWHYVWRKEDGSEMSMTGSYREVEPPSRVVSTEKWGEEWPETVNAVELTEDGAGRTICTTTVTYASRQVRDAAMATGMKDGADASFARLDDYLRTIA